jgi:anti-sigma regulatory factor (Ser/Thr protein kinase)
VIGEVGFGATPSEWREWAAYEAILNRAFSEHPAWIVCPYNARALPDEIIETAWHTHSRVLSGGWRSSTRYDDPELVVRSFATESPALPELREVPPGDGPGAFRDCLARELIANEVPEERARDLLIAGNEVVVNTWLHASGPTVLRLGWVGERFVCEIGDRGSGFDDPLAGYIAPEPEDLRGAGLWLARQLTWRLELLSSDVGLTVRLWV